ncbi:hypothetical protein EIP86_010070 [Pleurotus ostreatoroseus]|nr:hypothetical protein EIP86_010070 [Pleurotus ostreatoroseus]
MPSRASPSRAIKRKAVPVYLPETSSPESTDSHLVEENEIDALVEMYSSAARDGVRSGGRFDENTSSSSGSPSSVCSQIEPSADPDRNSRADSRYMNPDSAASAYLLLYSEPEAPHAGLSRRALYGRRSWEHMLTEYGNTMNSQEEQQFLSRMLARRRG